MKLYRVEAFQLEDFPRLTLRPQELEFFQTEDINAKVAPLFQMGTGYTLFKEDAPVCVGGFFPLWPGVYEMWMFPDVSVTQCSIIFLRTARRMLDLVFETHAIHRMQSSSISDTQTDLWMKFLGFEEEGLLKKYSPVGKDYKMWARITK